MLPVLTSPMIAEGMRGFSCGCGVGEWVWQQWAQPAYLPSETHVCLPLQSLQRVHGPSLGVHQDQRCWEWQVAGAEVLQRQEVPSGYPPHSQALHPAAA